MIDNDYSFTVDGEDGKEVKCEVLSVINRNEENSSPLIIYTDFKQGEDGKLNLYVSELINKEGEYILGEVDEETYSKIPQVREAIEKIWINNNK